MEWSKVKSGLIVLLLFVNVILLVNIGSKLSERQKNEQTAIASAVALLHDAGIEATDELFLNLPQKLYQYSFERDTDYEAVIAQALLGDYTVEKVGGGVVVYSGQTGKITFRSGGAFEMELLNRAPADWADAESYYVGLLKESGMIKDGTAVTMLEDRLQFTMQNADGYPVINTNILCIAQNGNAYLSGRWLFTTDFEATGVSSSRSELILALKQLRSEQGDRKQIKEIDVVYVLESTRLGSTSMVPVWRIQSEETILFNTITKKQILQ